LSVRRVGSLVERLVASSRQALTGLAHRLRIRTIRGEH
jgi:hypothetical protein